MAATIEGFIAKWQASEAAERANKDSFLKELCDVLGVAHPNPVTNDPARDLYVFEKDVTIVHQGAKPSVGKIDLYKHGAFLLEAKQGSNPGAAKVGSARRKTASWTVMMQNAWGQALGYARTLESPPPIIIVCDIGHCFDIYACFDGGRNWNSFPDAHSNRLFLADLPKHLDLLRKLWTDPLSLDPSRHAAKVTREVAAHLAELARAFETKHEPEAVARFLMRCIFTMFAEDVGLLPSRVFTDLLKNRWLPNPATFQPEVEALWQGMNSGGVLPFLGKLLKFNGGLFADATALPIKDAAVLKQLLEAAECGWGDVEPAIFGTLLERALDPRERHRLGAHYTPRAYVERLVRPTIEEPLREKWDAVRAEVLRMVGAATGTDTSGVAAIAPVKKGAKKKTVPSTAASRTKAVQQARALVQGFQKELCETRILDPACGTGNFLYVALDVLKRIEAEVVTLDEELARSIGAPTTLAFEWGSMVTPAQFLGIEKKRWAKEIAELVLWIGFLQWYARARRRPDGTVLWPEPVLRDLKNIECRDAVLAWDREEAVLDEAGKPVTRWDGVTMKRDPLTGRDVPDENAQVPFTTLVNPRLTTWPAAEYIVGNPPFLGGWKMRQALGDGYVEALRRVHDDVPDACDLVMYWWNHAAKLVRDGSVRRSGLVTTTTISQVQSRRVTQRFLSDESGVSIAFAIDDHPWATDRYGSAGENAEVRVAMTVIARGRSPGILGTVIREGINAKGELVVDVTQRSGWINADIKIGANVAGAASLRSNDGLSSPGVKLHGAGFIVSSQEARSLGLGSVPGLERHIRPYRNGKDLTSTPRDVMVIDLFGLREEDARVQFPAVFQRILECVKPERDHNARDTYRLNWWVFGEARVVLRAALKGLPRYFATPETARRRYFVPLDQDVLPDNAIVAIALDDWLHFGVLSSRAHTVWALAAGGGLGVRHEPRYNKTRCFDPFPFPVAPVPACDRVRAAAQALEAHRAMRQAAHPSLTLNGMYAVLEALREGRPLTDKEKVIHAEGLVSVLRQLHDELDAAVFDAYGWPKTLTDDEILERVVALNAERAAEERTGTIRWLRPEFQNPAGAKAAQQGVLDEGEVEELEAAPAGAAIPAWPKRAGEQFVAVRDLIASHQGAALDERVVRKGFKGASGDEVEEALDGLVNLGLAVRFADANGARWVRGAQPSA